MKNHADSLIVGGGIVAIAIARELVKQGAENIVILEKEPELGLHASGRNSGVLHAGIYYPPNTLKAQLCLKGNLAMQEYCREKNLPLVNSGKVIVTRTSDELPTLKELHQRAIQNGAKVDLIDEKELAKIEPHARTCEQALYSHYTAVIDNKAILKSLYSDLMQTGKVKFQFSTRFTGIKNETTALTNQGEYTFSCLINAAGSFADQVAHAFGVARECYLIPFKGIYKKLKPEYKHLVNGNIYPVPDIRNPFLGVHFTKNIHGDVYVGPTAIPAFGRENYGVLSGIDGEAFKILWHQAKMFVANPAFRSVALTEPKKYLSTVFFNDARKLVKQLEPSWLEATNKAGIRPQLIDVKTNSLLMDFKVIKEKHTIHILNAISPAFTSSLAFAEYVVREYANRP